MFCYAVRKQVVGMIAALDGVDMIVFTGGIGENDAVACGAICEGLSWIGVSLNESIVFAQLFNCFNARSETASAFVHLFVNRWLWGAIAVSVLLQVAVVNLGFLNLAFGTVPLAFDQWLLCAGDFSGCGI